MGGTPWPHRQSSPAHQTHTHTGTDTHIHTGTMRPLHKCLLLRVLVRLPHCDRHQLPCCPHVRQQAPASTCTSVQVGEGTCTGTASTHNVFVVEQRHDLGLAGELLLVRRRRPLAQQLDGALHVLRLILAIRLHRKVHPPELPSAQHLPHRRVLDARYSNRSNASFAKMCANPQQWMLYRVEGMVQSRHGT